ncbi:MAG: Cu(I)-responsive transcriptional regulator [Rhodospirillales bacterium]|nr:Cu(I)-responsive transcriptional regulator [Rhodospirillales bacterium]
MRIGEAAERSGVSAKTIRYYEEIGLILPAGRAQNGYRLYSPEDVQTLRFINRARGLGFSVDDCADLLALYRDRQRSSADVKAIAERNIGRIRQKIDELRTMETALDTLVDKCHGDERPDCPILDDMARAL